MFLPMIFFIVVDVIDDEQPFEVVMNKEEDRGEHS